MRKAFLLRASLLAALLSVAGMAQAQVTAQFDPSSLEVVTGTTATVSLNLSGVPSGVEAEVDLFWGGGVEQVTPDPVTFAAGVTSRELTITAGPTFFGSRAGLVSDNHCES